MRQPGGERRALTTPPAFEFKEHQVLLTLNGPTQGHVKRFAHLPLANRLIS